MEHTILSAAIVAGTLAAAHLAGPHIARWWPDARAFSSFAGGMALAYVFIQLLPEIETVESDFGDRAHGMTLVGMLVFYVGDVWARRRIERGGHPGAALALHSMFIIAYTWLVVVAIPETVTEQGALSASIVALAVALHMVRSGAILEERFPEHFGLWVRAIYAAAAVAGFLTVRHVEVAGNTKSLITAGLVGFLLLDVFKEELPERPRLRQFVAGCLAYVVPIFIVHGLL